MVRRTPWAIRIGSVTLAATSDSSSASTLRTAGSSALGSSENPRECSCGAATGRPVPRLTTAVTATKTDDKHLADRYRSGYRRLAGNQVDADTVLAQQN